MTWTALGNLEVHQDWQITPEIPANLGYVRLTFGTAGISIYIAQIDLDSGDFTSVRQVVSTPYPQILEFECPSIFTHRAIAIRFVAPIEPFNIKFELSDVPFALNGTAAPIPWDSPGAIGSKVPNTAKFRSVNIEQLENGRNTLCLSAVDSSGVSGVGYRFYLSGSAANPDLFLGSFFPDGSSFESVFSTKSYGETYVHAPLRLRYPIVLPIAPSYIPQDYVYYFSPSLFFQTASNNDVSLMVGSNGKLYRVPMELVNDWTS